MGANTELQRLPDRGWLNGFENLTRRELQRWWGRGWWKQLLRWTVIVNGVFAAISAAARNQPGDGGSPFELVGVFFVLSAVTTGIGMIVANQGAIIGERQSGTAAWVLSKPVSRTAFVLAKFAGTAIGFLAIVAIQGVLGYVNLTIWTGSMPQIAAYIGGVGLWMLTLLFYLSLVVMLGTVSSTRGGVIGPALGLLLFGQNFAGLKLFAAFGPFRLMEVAAGLVAGQALAPGYPLAILTTVLASVVMIVVAARRFEGQDL